MIFSNRMSLRLPICLIAAAILVPGDYFLRGFPALAQGQAPGPEAAAQQAQPADDQPAPLDEDDLEVLVARIALYPDELIALVSSASLYPLQIIEASRYLDNLKKDASLKPKDSWDGSIVSLLNYPEIVKMMSEDLDWTQTFGDAIAYQQKDVLVAIQTLRDKAVADNIIKTDDKIKVVEENDNVIIQSADPDSIYVPRYEPQMLYAEDYPPEPIGYYADPYPNYYYPTATFFAGAVTGAIFGAVVDWDDWGVWGGDFDGSDIDIDCDKCFNNINVDRKMNFNEVDWKNVDRSKIKFDKDQFSKLDRTNVKNKIQANERNNIREKARVAKNENVSRQRAGSTALNDVRANRVGEQRERPGAGEGELGGAGLAAAAGAGAAGAIAARGAGGAQNRPARNARETGRVNHPVSKPKPAAKRDNRPSRPSGLGEVRSGKTTKLQSNRGGQAMGGGISGGNRPQKQISRGGGGSRSMQRPSGGRSMQRPSGGGRSMSRGGGGGRGGGGRGRR
ncbi:MULTISPECIES: DUF3300 domain-containing protein [unclassified Sinorhizobium]|uniref:DUF3300 domain-containing protein n=1 Tax=unclassified Sinorhizobium TaxID=2613772 RepID=UPI0035247C62